MIYLDNGATTFPKPRQVVRAVNEALSVYGANPGRSGHDMSLKSSEIVYNCRSSAAELFDTDKPENVIFTDNCTTALNTVIKGILKSGDHAVISSLEHNSVVRPLEYLKTRGIEYTVADVVCGDDEQTIDNFRDAIKKNTRLVICTHASNVFGVKLPVERIAALCRIYGILFCVDAAQSAGVVPISLKDSYIDFLCLPGHKGLYGPMGTGILIINTDELPESLTCGGTGSESLNRSQPEILPDKYESGTPNLPGIAGLNEGIKYVINKKPEKIYDREMRLITYLYDRLKKMKNIILYTDRPEKKHFVPVLSFNIKNYDSENAALILNRKFRIAVRAGYHCAPLAHESFNTKDFGTIRVVASTFTTYDDINYLIRAISTFN